MASTIEAILGAVYLDSGMKSVTEVMQKLRLVPRLVRRTQPKEPITESVKSPAVSTPVVGDPAETETAPTDSDELLVDVMKSPQELEKTVREHFNAVQLKRRPDANVQSPP